MTEDPCPRCGHWLWYSSTYQAILEEGRNEGRGEGAVAEARRLLRLQGEEAFGPRTRELRLGLSYWMTWVD